MSGDAGLANTVSERLQEALDRDGKSMRWLHTQLDERGAPNSSWGAVRSYVRGDQDPPLNFLEEAADVLGVRIEWLFGSGERTPDEQRVAERVQAQKKPRTVLLDRVAEEHPEVERLPEAVQGLFLDVLASYALGAPDGNELVESEKGTDTLVELAGRLLFLLFLPLRWKAPLGAWGFIGFPHKTSSRDLKSYYVAMLHALQVAIPERGEGQEIDKAHGDLLGRLKDFVEEEEEEWEERKKEAAEEWDIEDQRPLAGEPDTEEES